MKSKISFILRNDRIYIYNRDLKLVGYISLSSKEFKLLSKENFIRMLATYKKNTGFLFSYNLDQQSILITFNVDRMLPDFNSPYWIFLIEKLNKIFPVSFNNQLQKCDVINTILLNGLEVSYNYKIFCDIKGIHYMIPLSNIDINFKYKKYFNIIKKLFDITYLKKKYLPQNAVLHPVECCSIVRCLLKNPYLNIDIVKNKISNDDKNSSHKKLEVYVDYAKYSKKQFIRIDALYFEELSVRGVDTCIINTQSYLKELRFTMVRKVIINGPGELSLISGYNYCSATVIANNIKKIGVVLLQGVEIYFPNLIEVYEELKTPNVFNPAKAFPNLKIVGGDVDWANILKLEVPSKLKIIFGNLYLPSRAKTNEKFLKDLKNITISGSIIFINNHKFRRYHGVQSI